MGELTPGTLIGARYRLDRWLGEGGMGVVWAATDVVSNEPCALKLIKDTAEDPGARRRFLHEGRAASAVRHPNVVTIREVIELEDGAPVLVMELLEGESLRDLLERERQIALAELIDLVMAVISAVGAAHALGVVHRDLKPENIFLSRGPAGERVVKVLDFGIAKLTALDGEAARSTGITTGMVLGTPAYMAPEQVYGQTDLDHRVDIWAIGLVFYQCLSGVLPTRGDNIGQVFKNVTARPFEPLDQLVPGVPGEICDLIARMLARERDDRPADLREVVEILQRLTRTEWQGFGPPARRLTAGGADTLPDRRVRRVDPLAATAPEIPRRTRPRRSRMIGAAAVVVLLGVGTSVWWWGSPNAATPAPESPLAPAPAKLACPILRASGVDQPAGWLGAAAAATACERARLILGGRPERTLVPAELLDLPRGPTDGFPRDPYGQPGARERSVTAAQQRAQAYLDGEVTWSSAGFAVVLSLHRPDGTSLATSAGEGRALYEAVRSAMIPLIRGDLIPKASGLEPAIAAWSRTTDIDDALGVLDLTFAFAHNAGGLPDECRRFEELSARVGELGPDGRWQCAYTLGRTAPDVTLDASDRSDAARATRIRINHAIHQVAEPADVKFLQDLFQREKTPRGRSLLAAIESCLLGSDSEAAARERALAAVQSEPKNPEGGWCNPWEQLMTLARDAAGADGTFRAMQAWVPWNSHAWLVLGFGSEKRDPAALPLLRRAYVLSPFDSHVADTLADSELASGDREAARGIAAELLAGGLPLHKVESDLILVRVKTSERHFGEALKLARKGSEISRGDAGWVRAQRFEVAWQALELAILLGRAREGADWMTERFLDPDPTPLDSNFASVPIRLPAICVLASAPDRCFARFRALRQKLPGAITPDTDTFLAGAERYARRDFPGAAKAWRPLLAGRMGLASVLPDKLVDAFERTNAADLAEQVDQEVMKRAGEFNGATLGHVRAARRALASGDRTRARQLAEQVIQAWSDADDEPPALAEMRRLVQQLQRR